MKNTEKVILRKRNFKQANLKEESSDDYSFDEDIVGDSEI